MELRVLHTAAHKVTWYGRFGYSLGRGAYNITRQQWRRAAEHVHGASLDALLFDFLGGVDDGVLAIVQRYRVSGSGWLRSLGPLLPVVAGYVVFASPLSNAYALFV
jgi:hypothetical protein